MFPVDKTHTCAPRGERSGRGASSSSPLTSSSNLAASGSSHIDSSSGRNCGTVRPHDQFIMKRLPGYDSRASRAELAAFSSLGLVGAALITAAVSNALKFAEARDQIVSELSVSGLTNRLVAVAPATNILTNVLRIQTAKPIDPRLISPEGSSQPQRQPL